MIRKVLPFALSVSAALLAMPLHAADPPPDAATVRMREQFRDGVKAYDAKEYAHALDDFRAAYATKPSPIIKQNIALCLRALGRDVEAVDTLESMLVEGQTLKPQARDLAAKAIAEMLAVIATAKIEVNEHVAMGASKVPSDVFVDDTLLAAKKRDESLRLDPGPHRFRSHAEGFIDAVKDVVLSPGQRDIVVVLDLVPMEAVAVPPHGGLRVKVPVGDAKIAIDDAPRERAESPFDLAVGPHRLSVKADGYVPYVADVTVVANEVSEVDVTLEPLPPAPPVVSGPSTPAPAKPRRLYVFGGVTLQSEALTLSSALDEGPAGGQHQFGGASATLEIGRTAKYLDFGALVELGVLTVHAYQSPNDTNQAARVNIFDWVVAPELRLHSSGRVYALGAAAVGLEGGSLSATLGESGGTQNQPSGSGVGLMGLVEGGAGIHFERTSVEATVFVDAHDVRGAKDDGARLFLDSPAVRGGFRLMVGYGF